MLVHLCFPIFVLFSVLLVFVLHLHRLGSPLCYLLDRYSCLSVFSYIFHFPSFIFPPLLVRFLHFLSLHILIPSLISFILSLLSFPLFHSFRFSSPSPLPCITPSHLSPLFPILRLLFPSTLRPLVRIRAYL